MSVFVATEETTIIGVYSTRESAQDACDTYSVDAAERHPWQRYDGAWQRYVKYVDTGTLVLRVTECDVEE